VNVSFDKISEERKGMKRMLMLLNGLYVMNKWEKEISTHLNNMDINSLLLRTDTHVVNMAIQYFGMKSLNPSLVDYIKSIPAKEIGERFLN
jgi:hypothetical protein